MKEKIVGNVRDEYMAQWAVDLLKSEDIDSYYKPFSSGEVTEIYTGHSITGYVILVREADYDKAMEVMKYFE